MKKILAILGAVLILIQFLPVNLPQTTTDNPEDLLSTTQVPENVANMLKASCYDCHSNETVYPWYSSFVPVSYLIIRDIREGRKKLNFSEWNKLSKVKKAKALDGINDEISEGEMPMKIYTVIHSGTSLSEKQKGAILNWANNYGERLFGD